ncbi:uncharacterized protein LOC126765532 [Bactrocera neohumeralis]|uniref:uncharacterized protein LOC126765532 n=1 Tax=Bactrocera neohumeralis TaxID=98809 RepID=UPI0021668FE5|nr:uncharacterized protein LOC126765532 [Bactrocera neohumeralis]
MSSTLNLSRSTCIFQVKGTDQSLSMRSSRSVLMRTSLIQLQLRDLRLADPTFGIPGPLELLIGQTFGLPNQPVFITNLISDDSTTDKLLREFWAMEEPPDTIKLKVDECEETFTSTATRHTNGQYIVQIPFQSNAPPYGNSHSAALRQFFKLERALANDYVLKEKYLEFMKEYMNLGHMEAIDAPIDAQLAWKVVITSLTLIFSKLRVMFNASSKTTTCISLNDTQLSGTQLQENVDDILHRFRRYSVALTAAERDSILHSFYVNDYYRAQDVDAILHQG